MSFPRSPEYQPADNRYEVVPYRRCGRSGLKLPIISLGLWHNFGGVDSFDNARGMVRRAFDLGITHFDLANNYGPPPGSAETTFGRILRKDLVNYRDELVISTKAGYDMWPGPYGEWGSRKYLIASLDQSLKRLGIDYVDIFYHHRPDPDTPLEETMSALDQVVRQGKALYVGISNYDAEQMENAARILRALGTPCVVNQVVYHMFNRWVEPDVLDVAEREGIGLIFFSPLAQGLLTDRYLREIPADSRAARPSPFLQLDDITDHYLSQAKNLNEIAHRRDQELSQMALAWVLRHPASTSALIGVSNVEQLEQNIATVEQSLDFTAKELQSIDRALEQ